MTENKEFYSFFVEQFETAVSFEGGKPAITNNVVAHQAIQLMLDVAETEQRNSWDIVREQIGPTFDPIFPQIQALFRTPRPTGDLAEMHELPALDFNNSL